MYDFYDYSNGHYWITTNNVVVSLIYLEYVYINIILSTQALSRPFLWFGKNNLVALKTKKAKVLF